MFKLMTEEAHYIFDGPTIELNKTKLTKAYLSQLGRLSIVYASLILLATPEKDLKVAAACLTASDSIGCCQAHSNCKCKSN